MGTHGVDHLVFVVMDAGLGDDNYQIVFEVTDVKQAFQIAQLIERPGLDTRTATGTSLARFGDLVDDI